MFKNYRPTCRSTAKELGASVRCTACKSCFLVVHYLLHDINTIHDGICRACYNVGSRLLKGQSEFTYWFLHDFGGIFNLLYCLFSLVNLRFLLFYYYV